MKRTTVTCKVKDEDEMEKNGENKGKRKSDKRLKYAEEKWKYCHESMDDGPVVLVLSYINRGR